MIQTGLISPAHDDLICDAAFDYYGTRLATCSFDQKIKIWREKYSTSSQFIALDHTEPNTSNAEGSPGDNWVLEDSFKAHDAPILSLSWAHPEYGRMLVSGSMDRTVKIWEWVPPFLGSHKVVTTNSASKVDGSGGKGDGSGGTGTRWRLHTVLTDAKGSVHAVKFAPPVFGLKLAALATDNILRIYECIDSEHFTIVDTIDVPALSPIPPISTSTSNNGIAGLPIPKIFTSTSFEMDGAPDTPHTLFGTSNGSAFTSSAGATGSKNAQGVVIKEADGGWTLSWCKDAYWGQILAVGCGNEGIVKVVQVCTLEQQNHALVTLDPYTLPSSSTVSSNATLPTSSSSAPAPTLPGLTTPSQELPSSSARRYSVSSLSWAPTCGRSYHTLATGSRDGRVRIWRIRAPPIVLSAQNMHAPNNTPMLGVSDLGTAGGLEEGKGGKERWSASLVADFREHEYTVSKVDWNVTGTTLTSSGGDGHVRLWKMSLGGVWRPMVSMNAMQRESMNGTGTGGKTRAVDVEMD